MTQDNMDEIIMGIENYISEEQKWKEKSVRFNTKQLPKETNWRDVHIYILNFAITNPKRTKIIVTIPETDFELETDMEDIGLYDRKRGLISSEWVLLGFLSTGKLFSWSEWGMAPDSFRTAKLRLAAVLEKYFGLDWSPIMLQWNRYELAFWISCWNQVKTIFEWQSITNLYP